jgi:hypothetical protein
MPRSNLQFSALEELNVYIIQKEPGPFVRPEEQQSPRHSDPGKSIIHHLLQEFLHVSIFLT